MTLKFAPTPQVFYNGDPTVSTWSRFPQGTQPIATAPERTSQPLIVHEANGRQHWALHHHGAWQKLEPFQDWRTGSVSWRMSGQSIPNPVAWSMPQKKA